MKVTDKFKGKIWLPILIAIIGGSIAYFIGHSTPSPIKRDILIKARQYAYEPSKIIVNIGDTLHIKLTSLDVVHGFFVEGYDADAEIYPGNKKFKFRKPSEGYEWEEIEELVLVMNKNGKFRYRCSHTCGTMHPFMQGELIVRPNSPYHAGIGGFIGFVLGIILMLAKKPVQKVVLN